MATTPASKKTETMTVSVSGPVRPGTGGARSSGNVMVCDFDPKESNLEDLEWKPFMELNVEVAVLPRDDGSVLVFTRRRILEGM